MTSDPPRLSFAARLVLVLALWLFLLLVLGSAVRNFEWLTSWAGTGLLHACLLLAALVIGFSMLAGAVHISADTLRGRFPYPATPPPAPPSSEE
jgi:hypothetical protein